LNIFNGFHNGTAAQYMAKEIRKEANNQQITVMEVCGTHTMSIARYGLRELLPDNITLLSGPGCPVCVTPNRIIDHAIALAREPDVIITTFGDMMKVPGSTSRLDIERARGATIKVVTSTLEAIMIAQKNPDQNVVFLGVGFETTAPTIAVSLIEARKQGLNNYFLLEANKVIPPALEVLSQGDVHLDGYLCPGHVSTIIGTLPYEPIIKKYGLGCVVAGFEPLDILQSILMLVRQVKTGKFKIEIQYGRVVKTEGNPKAKEIMNEVFEHYDSEWRGFGVIPGSGLRIRKDFQTFDAALQLDVEVEPVQEPKGCRCGEVLQGKVKPPECPHFGSLCNPENPVGPCMVSSEGTCAAYYKYHLE